VFPVGIGLRDPRSQKRDLGHPSIARFDIAERTCFDKGESGFSSRDRFHAENGFTFQVYSAVGCVTHARQHSAHVSEASDDARHRVVTVNLVFQIYKPVVLHRDQRFEDLPHRH
jgi:hypothetical protein